MSSREMLTTRRKQVHQLKCGKHIMQDRLATASNPAASDTLGSTVLSTEAKSRYLGSATARVKGDMIAIIGRNNRRLIKDALGTPDSTKNGRHAKQSACIDCNR